MQHILSGPDVLAEESEGTRTTQLLPFPVKQAFLSLLGQANRPANAPLFSYSRGELILISSSPPQV